MLCYLVREGLDRFVQSFNIAILARRGLSGLHHLGVCVCTANELDGRAWSWENGISPYEARRKSSRSMGIAEHYKHLSDTIFCS
jgi:hypothetical protein